MQSPKINQMQNYRIVVVTNFSAGGPNGMEMRKRKQKMPNAEKSLRKAHFAPSLKSLFGPYSLKVQLIEEFN